MSPVVRSSLSAMPESNIDFRTVKNKNFKSSERVYINRIKDDELKEVRS